MYIKYAVIVSESFICLFMLHLFAVAVVCAVVLEKLHFHYTALVKRHCWNVTFTVLDDDQFSPVHVCNAAD